MIRDLIEMFVYAIVEADNAIYFRRPFSRKALK